MADTNETPESAGVETSVTTSAKGEAAEAVERNAAATKSAAKETATSAKATATAARATARSAAKEAAETAKDTAHETAATAKTRAAHDAGIVERVVIMPVGATLVVRDDILSSVRKLTKKYGTPAGREKELTRYEKRGTRACNKVERQVKREVRSRRKQIETQANTIGKRFESQTAVAGAAVDGITTKLEEIVSTAHGLIS